MAVVAHQFVGSWLGKRLDLIFLIPHISSYGNAIEDYLAGLQAARRLNRKLVIIWPIRRMLFFYKGSHIPPAFTPDFLMFGNSSVAFKYRGILFRFFGLVFTLYFVIAHIVWRIYRKLVGGGYDDAYNHPTMGQEWLWRPIVNEEFSRESVEEMKWPQQYSQFSIPTLLDENVKKDLHTALHSMGVKPGAWFVCIHIRESGYRNDPGSPRNGDPRDFLPAIEEIIRRGGLVVRLGDKSMTPLPPLPGLVDYALSGFQSTLMDAFLVSECSFFVGTSSGPHALASLFGKTLILTNVTNYIYGLAQNPMDLTLFQHVFSKRLNREIRLKEWLTLWTELDSQTWTSEDWVLRRNSPDEIRDVVIELLDGSKGRFDRRQGEFKSLHYSTIAGFFEQGDAFSGGTGNEDPRFRYAANALTWEGRIGDIYLEEHWE